MLPHKLYPWGDIIISMVKKKTLLGISLMPPNSLTRLIKKKKKKKTSQNGTGQESWLFKMAFLQNYFFFLVANFLE